jgi:hypothetical protein
MTLSSTASFGSSKARLPVPSGKSTPVPQGDPVTIRLEPRVVWIPSGSKREQSVRLHMSSSPLSLAEGCEEPGREKAATLKSHIVRTAKTALEERHPDWDSEVCTAATEDTFRELQAIMSSLGANVAVVNDMAEKGPQPSERHRSEPISDNARNTSCECPKHFTESKVSAYLQQRKHKPVVRFWNGEERRRPVSAIWTPMRDCSVRY